MEDKDKRFLYYLRGNLIGGLKGIEQELGLPPTIPSSEELILLRFIRENAIDPLDARDSLKRRRLT